MTKIGYISPSSTHASRGIGFYSRNLISGIKEIEKDSNIQLIEFKNESEVPSDINIIHYPFFDLFYNSLPILSNKRRIITVHDLIPLKFPEIYKKGYKASLNLFLQRIALNNSDMIITDSYSSVIDIVSMFKINSSRIKLIPLAPGKNFKVISDKSNLGRVKNKFKLPDKFIIYVGDMNYNKNLTRLVKVCIKCKIPIVLAGKSLSTIQSMDLGHPELNHLIELKSLASSKYVKILGFVENDELVSLYNLATLSCSPSIAEGFGFSVVESLACGTPAVCSNTSSLSEFMDNSILHFNPYSEEDIEKNILKVYYDDDSIHKMSKSGLEFVKKYSWDLTAKNTISIYKNVI